jgi:hypothetical protein
MVRAWEGEDGAWWEEARVITIGSDPVAAWAPPHQQEIRDASLVVRNFQLDRTTFLIPLLVLPGDTREDQ